MIESNLKQCSCCGKKLRAIRIITRVNIAVSSFYVRRDKKLEDMNGLSKNVNEFLCESCFDRLVDYIEQFSEGATPAKVPVAKTVGKQKSAVVKSATTTKSSLKKGPAKKTVKKKTSKSK